MIDLDVQRATPFEPVPDDRAFELWVNTALQGRSPAALVIRVVGRQESRRLNRRYRGRDAATNVLSFAADLPPDIGLPLLGDIVICAPLADAEAAARGKQANHHWAHLTLHGVLHLLGYDHTEPTQAAEMEALETSLLASLGIPDPYAPAGA